MISDQNRVQLIRKEDEDHCSERLKMRMFDFSFYHQINIFFFLAHQIIKTNLQLDSEYFPIERKVDTFGRIAGKLSGSLSEKSKDVSRTICHSSGCNSIAAMSICNAIAPIISMQPLTS